jgi:hypothetical protein
MSIKNLLKKRHMKQLNLAQVGEDPLDPFNLANVDVEGFASEEQKVQLETAKKQEAKEKVDVMTDHEESEKETEKKEEPKPAAEEKTKEVEKTEVKVEVKTAPAANKTATPPASKSAFTGGPNAILVTGATHARELLSA